MKCASVSSSPYYRLKLEKFTFIAIMYSSCHPGCHPAGNIPDPTLPFRSVYPPRLFSGSSSTLMPPPPPPQPPQPYLYQSPPRLTSYPSQYSAHPVNEYYVGHVLGSSSSQYPHQNLNYMAGAPESSYTCIGAPVGHGFGPGSSRGSDIGGLGGGGGVGNLDEGLSWGRSYGGGRQQRLDHNPSINRFQEGF